MKNLVHIQKFHHYLNKTYCGIEGRTFLTSDNLSTVTCKSCLEIFIVKYGEKIAQAKNRLIELNNENKI